MKRKTGGLTVVGAVSLVLSGACGGSTETFSPMVGDAGVGDASSQGAASSSALDSSTVDGPSLGADAGSSSATVTPGSLGGLVSTGSGATDAGAALGTAAGGAGTVGLSVSDAGGLIQSDGGVIAVYGTGISQPVVDGCAALCAKEATAMCPNAGTLQSCLVGCQLLVGHPSCAAEATSLFACSSTTPASCDASGSPTFTGCDVQALTSEACFLTNAVDPALKAPCTTYCTNVAAAQCPNDDTLAGCTGGCQVLGSIVPACAASWSAYTACADGAKLTCDANGKASAPGCGVQAITFWACAATGLAPLAAADAGL